MISHASHAGHAAAIIQEHAAGMASWAASLVVTGVVVLVN